jgi:hypothetical protein
VSKSKATLIECIHPLTQTLFHDDGSVHFIYSAAKMPATEFYSIIAQNPPKKLGLEIIEQCDVMRYK